VVHLIKGIRLPPPPPHPSAVSADSCPTAYLTTYLTRANLVERFPVVSFRASANNKHKPAVVLWVCATAPQLQENCSAECRDFGRRASDFFWLLCAEAARLVLKLRAGAWRAARPSALGGRIKRATSTRHRGSQRERQKKARKANLIYMACAAPVMQQLRAVHTHTHTKWSAWFVYRYTGHRQDRR
jgi:hypothetical protein